jgi:hypothetical protein
VNVPPLSPDPLSLGVRRAGEDAPRPAAGFCTPTDLDALREVEQSAWYRAFLARHRCHAFEIVEDRRVCLDCGSIS